MNPVRTMAKPADCSRDATGSPPLPPVPSIVTQRYRICALCTIDHGEDVERLMRHQLRTPAIHVDRIAREGHSSRHLVRVVAVVSCAARARAVLFRLVNRLGFDVGVRSICWETATSAPTHATECRFAAPVAQTHSAAMVAADRVVGTSH